VIANNKVETEFGIFDLNCKQNKGEKANLLLTQSSNAKDEVIKVKVEDVLYKQNQFEVKSRGAKFIVKEKPNVGEFIKVNVQVECLE